MKKIITVLVCSILLIVVFVLAVPSISLAGDKPEGQPFDSLWAAITNLDQRIENEGMPTGAIIMWSGNINSNGNPIIGGSPDTNWHICDGTSGTPDLRDRFIVGSGNSYGSGTTGGADSVILNSTQMPSHQHHIQGPTGYAGGHRHSYTDFWYGGDKESVSDGVHDAADDHIDQTQRYTGFESSHYHIFVGDTWNTGGNQPHENRPPYYAMAFIMKMQ